MTESELSEKQIKLCECGCGQPAPIAKKTITAKGYKKGEPRRFILGHNSNGQNHPNWKGGKVQVVCAQCGNIIYRKPDQVKRAKNNFCNHKCFSLWKRINKTGKNNPAWKGGLIKVICDQCGKEFEKRRYAVRNDKKNFCNHKCQGGWTSINQSGKGNPRWLGGLSYGGYCPIWTDKEFKEYIFERDNYKCQNPDCRKNSNILCRHHIDFNKKNCEPSNIILLCNSCNGRANADRDWHTAYYNAIMAKKNYLAEIVSHGQI